MSTIPSRARMNTSCSSASGNPLDRRSFITHALAAGALLAAPRWSRSAAEGAAAKPVLQTRVLVDWHSHFVSNAEIKFFAARGAPPRLLSGSGGVTRL